MTEVFDHYHRCIESFSKNKDVDAKEYPDFPSVLIPEIAHTIDTRAPDGRFFDSIFQDAKLIHKWWFRRWILPSSWRTLVNYLLFCYSYDREIMKQVYDYLTAAQRVEFKKMLCSGFLPLTIKEDGYQVSHPLWMWHYWENSPVEPTTYLNPRIISGVTDYHLARAASFYNTDLEVFSKIITTEEEILTYLNDTSYISPQRLPELFSYFRSKISLPKIIQTTTAHTFLKYLSDEDIRSGVLEDSEAISYLQTWWNPVVYPTAKLLPFRGATLRFFKKYCKHPENYQYFRLLPEADPQSPKFQPDEVLKREAYVAKLVLAETPESLCSLVLSVVILQTELYELKCTPGRKQP